MNNLLKKVLPASAVALAALGSLSVKSAHADELFVAQPSLSVTDTSGPSYYTGDTINFTGSGAVSLTVGDPSAAGYTYKVRYAVYFFPGSNPSTALPGTSVDPFAYIDTDPATAYPSSVSIPLNYSITSLPPDSYTAEFYVEAQGKMVVGTKTFLKPYKFNFKQIQFTINSAPVSQATQLNTMQSAFSSGCKPGERTPAIFMNADEGALLPLLPRRKFD